MPPIYYKFSGHAVLCTMLYTGSEPTISQYTRLSYKNRMIIQSTQPDVTDVPVKHR